jgi:hypothetical protein
MSNPRSNFTPEHESFRPRNDAKSSSSVRAIGTGM